MSTSPEADIFTGLVGSKILFPKGDPTAVSLSRDAPGPVPCPGGDIIAPFAFFPPPAPGMKRWFRLKAVYFDENAGGANNVKVIFNMTSGAIVTFTLPQCASAGGASNFHYSDWYQPDVVDGSYATITAFFDSQAPYNNSAGIYSLILEAQDVYPSQTAPDHSYTITLENQSTLTLITDKGEPIAPGATWTSEPLGNGYVSHPLFGTLSCYDMGQAHVDGDSEETWGCLVSLRGFQCVGRYKDNGKLSVKVNPLLQATLDGLDFTPVSLDALEIAGSSSD
jgi:hypothetical protein